MIDVRGSATAEELAAVLAVLTVHAPLAEPAPDPYQVWRRTRLRAQRAVPEPLRHNRQM